MFTMLEEDRFAGFVNAGVVDAHQQQEVLLCLTWGCRKEVDRTVEKAVASGGRPWKLNRATA